MSDHKRDYVPVVWKREDLERPSDLSDFASMDRYFEAVDAWLRWRDRPLISSRGMSRKQQRRRGYVAKAKRQVVGP